MNSEIFTPDKISSAVQKNIISEKQTRKIALSVFPNILKDFAQRKGFHNTENMIEANFMHLISENLPLQFIGFWGVGKKSVPDNYDLELLNTYGNLQKQVQAVYSPGAEITLLLADIHGMSNGFNRSDDYHPQIANLAHEQNIQTVNLSSLYESWGLDLLDPQNGINTSLDVYHSVWQNPKYFRQQQQMIVSAQKHGRQDLDPETVAFYYANMRHQEKEPLSQTFPDAILMVNGSKSMGKVTLPLNMPHMYLKIGPVWFYEE